MAYDVVRTKRFEKEFKKAQKPGKDMLKLCAAVDHLAKDRLVPRRYQPHILSGNWAGVWECHIEPDWLLIDECIDDRIILRRTGTHSDLFKK